ncbi:MAG: HAMP domain-containing histidine kinase [Firmicutes bacterium]|nr:HAMP domain-containing histidine kinase [[Eubacterium] siraeum]MCM1488865.1 HAMP domain-containing histidine kinase [Bacillota bacterium]
MKNKLITASALFSLIIALIFICFCFAEKSSSFGNESSAYIVSLNEIEQLNNNGDYDKANEKISALQENMRSEKSAGSVSSLIPALCGISLLYIITVFGYIYFAVLRPFEKMKIFASEISAGNLDIPLNYERSRYFGEFTWAFDSMRTEINKARKGEKEAVENNKTVIATLSHDIKTPIASIRAYAEGLSANMDTSFEKREKYLGVIIKKCDEVSRLTDDLFLHSITDMDKLKFIPEEIELCGFAERVIKEIGAERSDINFKKPEFSAYINIDKNRLVQLCENIINNGRKYAKTDIDVFITKENGEAALHFRDYGSGIPNDSVPFVFDKFYRGSNCGGEQGSGLGLYIVKYIAEKSGGNVLLRNHSRGLEVEVIFPAVK